MRARVLTAALMAAIVIGVLLRLPPSAGDVLVTLVMLLGALEWSALLRAAAPLKATYVAMVALCLWLIWPLTSSAAALQPLLWLALLWWLVALAWIMFAPQRAPRVAMAAAGLLALVPAWAAIIVLRNGRPDGGTWTLFGLAMIVAADTGAFFAGRRFGRLRLAARVSPGKTWEGVIGGVLLTALVGVLGSRVLHVDALTFLPVALAVAAFAVIGDLIESLIKRSAGVKDSGTLVPGHGGVLDRIDSLTAAAPILLLGLYWLGVYS